MNTKTLIFLTYCILIPELIFSQIINKGTLQIKSSTIVYFENEYINQIAGIHNNDGDLYLNNNLINHGTTVSNSGTTYFNSSSNAVQTISGTSNSVNFYNLEVNKPLTGVSVVNNYGLIVKNKY